MKKPQGLRTLGDYRRVARESLFGLELPPDNKSTSPYDAVKTALVYSRHLISFSRADIPEKDWWLATYFIGEKYEMRNVQLFYAIKLMEFAITYEEVSFKELVPNWLERPDANARVFTVAGLSYLEAAFEFVRGLGRDVISILQKPYMKYRKESNIIRGAYDFLGNSPQVDELEINPVPDIIIKTWFDEILQGMRWGFPESEYPDRRVDTEFNSTFKQLEYERKKQTRKNLMTSTLVVKHFKVSLATLRRYVKDEKLTDY